MINEILVHKSKFGEIVLEENDLCNLVMQGQALQELTHVVVSSEINLEKLLHDIEDPGALATWTFPISSDISVSEFDLQCQSRWFMPDEYKNMDIAKYLLDLCHTQDQLQRVGKELLLYQDRNLMDLLRYLKYLVDTMRANNIIWGVGRGSSVSSYVLYLLGVHRVDSMYYDLNVEEFLR
jgi:DNA polymerase III alpha subunit